MTSQIALVLDALNKPNYVSKHTYLMTELTQESIDSNKVEFELIASEGVVASRLNITQEHFSRVLHDLSATGLLKINGKKIWIPSVSALLRNQEAP